MLLVGRLKQNIQELKFFFPGGWEYGMGGGAWGILPGVLIPIETALTCSTSKT